MTYCTASDVRLVINTSLTDSEVTSIIEQSDAEIDKRIGSQASNYLVEKLSALITAKTIKARQPQTTAIGEYREDQGNILQVWSDETERIFRLFSSSKTVASSYNVIDESDRYKEDGS